MPRVYDWEQKKSILQDMYLSQNMQLKDISTVMREQYAFNPR